MEEINAVITGVGGYVPDYILDNEEMSTIVDTSDEWIMERIGVKTRHILKPEQGSGTSYLMTRAVQQLLRKTGANPDCIELVICATTTPDYHFPSTASLVRGNCGLKTPLASIWKLPVQVSFMLWRQEPLIFAADVTNALLSVAVTT